MPDSVRRMTMKGVVRLLYLILLAVALGTPTLASSVKMGAVDDAVSFVKYADRELPRAHARVNRVRKPPEISIKDLYSRLLAVYGSSRQELVKILGEPARTENVSPGPRLGDTAVTQTWTYEYILQELPHSWLLLPSDEERYYAGDAQLAFTLSSSSAKVVADNVHIKTLSHDLFQNSIDEARRITVSAQVGDTEVLQVEVAFQDSNTGLHKIGYSAQAFFPSDESKPDSYYRCSNATFPPDGEAAFLLTVGKARVLAFATGFPFDVTVGTEVFDPQRGKKVRQREFSRGRGLPRDFCATHVIFLGSKVQFSPGPPVSNPDDSAVVLELGFTKELRPPDYDHQSGDAWAAGWHKPHLHYDNPQIMTLTSPGAAS